MRSSLYNPLWLPQSLEQRSNSWHSGSDQPLASTAASTEPAITASVLGAAPVLGDVVQGLAPCTAFLEGIECSGMAKPRGTCSGLRKACGGRVNIYVVWGGPEASRRGDIRVASGSGGGSGAEGRASEGSSSLG